ncbi:FecR family protein [Pseudoxanthomonas sp. JBR18]|uniref:FecR family protein n=1 Tax=Pseudoxanthomonas sp. JBR18 TaxID=2969308 RepID=UPI0023059C91|nr:FecR family protein [Pseudoxanthomonas sp. JBR18]WCE03797.1 FecR family protein [Pseudoxanthomonas sp. JBR18]
MKLCLRLVALLCLVCLAIPVLAAESTIDDGHVALVKQARGSVTITRGGKTLEAAGGAQLEVSDRVVTGAGATASIVFRDGTLLTLGQDADIVVRDYVFAPKEDKFSFSLYMTRGSAIYESGKIGKLDPESVKIETPKATVGVRGTRFLIEAN